MRCPRRSASDWARPADPSSPACPAAPIVLRRDRASGRFRDGNRPADAAARVPPIPCRLGWRGCDRRHGRDRRRSPCGSAAADAATFAGQGATEAFFQPAVSQAETARRFSPGRRLRVGWAGRRWRCHSRRRSRDRGRMAEAHGSHARHPCSAATQAWRFPFIAGRRPSRSIASRRMFAKRRHGSRDRERVRSRILGHPSSRRDGNRTDARDCAAAAALGATAAAQACSGGRRWAQGDASSSSAQSAISSSSAPNRAARWMPTGSPSAVMWSGSDAAGWPVALKAAV